MGPNEQAYVSSLTNPRVIGEGGESVVFRTPGDAYVTKAFRDRAKFARSNRTSSERADSTVVAGQIGIAPPAHKDGKRIVRQKYVDVGDASIEDALHRRDTGPITRVLERLKRYHKRGIYLGDTAVSNLFDPARTGGIITVDATHVGYSGNERQKYALGDLEQTLFESDYRNRGDIFLDAVGRVYGRGVQEELIEKRAEQKRRGRVKRIHLRPLEAEQLRRAA